MTALFTDGASGVGCVSEFTRTANSRTVPYAESIQRQRDAQRGILLFSVQYTVLILLFGQFDYICNSKKYRFSRFGFPFLFHLLQSRGVSFGPPCVGHQRAATDQARSRAPPLRCFAAWAVLWAWRSWCSHPGSCPRLTRSRTDPSTSVPGPHTSH